MYTTIHRLNGSTLKCVDGQMRLRLSVQIMEKVPLQDPETQETFYVHEVNGQIVEMDDGSQDRADTLPA